jgi:hypothetical protein
MALLSRRIALLGTWVIASACLAGTLRAATASPLFARGYTVIPQPQKVTLDGQDFELTASWRLELGAGVEANDAAVESLKGELQERFHLALSEAKGKSGPTLRLAVDPHAVEVGEARDKDKSALAEQAYRLELSAAEITMVAGRGDYRLAGFRIAIDLLG